ncbi:uncharacterized protein METZ01_LOCUS396718 [marine metagenome]|uniref:Uncharacterized protein n=1 Tax=marine metagenome TaxID=408172 RepID=A0A382VBK1_9ZZZZ
MSGSEQRRRHRIAGPCSDRRSLEAERYR